MEECPREGYPTYGVPKNVFGSIPKYLFLDWNDAQKATDHTQYQTWVWNLTNNIQGYRYCSLVSVAFQATNYTTNPKYLGLCFSGFGTPGVQVSRSAVSGGPTFLVPNNDPAVTTGAQFYDPGRDEYMAQVGLGSLSSLTFTFVDETLTSPVVVAVPPGGFYFYVLLKFWN